LGLRFLKVLLGTSLRSAGQTVVTVTPMHAEEPKIRRMLTELSQ
jgi:hypothetical protein